MPSGSPPIPPPASRPASPPEVVLDIRGEGCPYTFLRSKLALETLAVGQLLRVVVGDETSARDVPRSLSAAGHSVLAVEPLAPRLWAILVRKGG